MLQSAGSMCHPARTRGTAKVSIRMRQLRLATLWVPLLAMPSAAAGSPRWPLASPDRSCEIVLSLGEDGKLAYQVKRAGKVVLQDSPLGLVLGTNDFTGGLRFRQAGAVETRRERYELFAGIVPQVDRIVNHRSVEFYKGKQPAMVVDLAASDQGVAFRYRFPSRTGGTREVSEEKSGFHLPPDARGWMQPYHAAGPFTPAYEDFYFHVSPGDSPPRSREKPLGLSFPALFKVPSADSWMLITEVSGTDPYPACHLAAASANGAYQIAFPRQDERRAEEFPEGPDRPKYHLRWTMPWRTIVLGGNATDIATSTLVTDLAPPSRIANTSWIRPGRASWAWWSHPEGPFTEAAFNGFTDFAADMGWQYTLFDANWWDPGLAPLIRHAVSRQVAPMMWTHARDFEGIEKRRSKLDKIAGDGAVGFKADFWCSDRQETIETIQALFADAADRKCRGAKWHTGLRRHSIADRDAKWYDLPHPRQRGSGDIHKSRLGGGSRDYRPAWGTCRL